METFDESGIAVAMEIPMDMVAEEVVTQGEVGADSDGQTAAVDSLTLPPSANILSKFGEELRCLGDSSEEEDNSDSSPAVSRLYASGQNAAVEGSSDLWTGSVGDDCLCWECGERFSSLERLMIHFRMHEACVRCNMCQVTFRRVVSLSMHLDNVHNNVDLHCVPCHRSFRSKWDLNEHLGTPEHPEPGELRVAPGLPPPCGDPQKETEVWLVASHIQAPIPEPVSLPVSVPKSVPVSAPVSRPITMSAPISVSTPKSVPVSRAVPVSGPKSVPFPAPVPLAVPVSVPIFLPMSIPLSLPVSVPIPTSVPGPISVSVPVSRPVPMSVPVPMEISTPSPTSTLEDQGSPLDESILPELVARDHTYNNSRKPGNGAAAGTYTLRHSKRILKALPQKSLPESAQQKNIHPSLLLDVDQQQEEEARVRGAERDKHLEEFALDNDVKPDATSLIPPLPQSLASLQQGAKREGVDPYNKEVSWDGEPIEEDEDLDHSGEEVQSDGSMSLEDCSEYDPGSDSDISTESFSSGNSSGSSYSPNKRQGKRTRTRRHHRVKKLKRAGSSQVVIAPARQPVASDSVKFHQCVWEQPSLQPSVQAAVKPNITDTSVPGGHKILSRPSLRPSRMYACDQCREVFPEQVSYRRHHCPVKNAAMMQMAVPCTIQNSTLVSSLPVASGPVFTLPSIMLPSPSPSMESGPQPIMATVVFNGNSSAGRVTRLVLQSQGLTFPTHTLSQTRPIRLSVPTQANASTPGQASPSMQLANLMIGGLMQPQTLVKSPHLTPPSTPSMVHHPHPGYTPTPAPISTSDTALIPAPVHIPALTTISAPTATSVAGPGPISAPSVKPATPPITILSPITAHGPKAIPTTITVPGPKTILTPITAPGPKTIPTPITAHGLKTVPTPITAPGPKTVPTPITAPGPKTVPTPITAPGPKTVPTTSAAPGPKTVLTTITAPGPKTVPTAITAPGPKAVLTPIAAAGPQTILTPITAPGPKTVTTPITAPGPKTVTTPITASFCIPALIPDPGPLRILGMFANSSQEVALEKRLEKSWRSKGVFLCRQCGAVSRQPSLGVRHRYLHRGSRRHRCHCGRSFLRRLHLLRHHVQHAEATRFVCAPCGQTFSGARCLARHKQDQEGKRKKKARSSKDCHTPFSCDCGQIFQRPTAFLWHKLKNPKQWGAGGKGAQCDYPSDNTASQIETCPL